MFLENRSHDYVSGFRLEVGTRELGRATPVELESCADPMDGRVAAVGRIVARFVNAIVDGGSVTPNLSHGVRVQNLIAAVCVADATGQAQETRFSCLPS
jgi:hypothetical protein